MEYQKLANLLSDESHKPSKFKIRNWVEINDEARGIYSPNKQTFCLLSKHFNVGMSTFQRFRLILRHHVAQRQINIEATLCT